MIDTSLWDPMISGAPLRCKAGVQRQLACPCSYVRANDYPISCYYCSSNAVTMIRCSTRTMKPGLSLYDCLSSHSVRRNLTISHNAVYAGNWYLPESSFQANFETEITYTLPHRLAAQDNIVAESSTLPPVHSAQLKVVTHFTSAGTNAKYVQLIELTFARALPQPLPSRRGDTLVQPSRCPHSHL